MIYPIREGCEKIPELEYRLFRTAGWRLQQCLEKYKVEGWRWLKAEMTSPSAADLILGYRDLDLFIVPLATEGDCVLHPDDDRVLPRMIKLTRKNDAIPCIFPVWEDEDEGEGWNLYDAEAFLEGDFIPIDPLALASDRLVEMSDWDLYDFSIQIAKDALVKQGNLIESWQNVPGINPQVFFKSPDGKLNWLEVRWYLNGEDDWEGEDLRELNGVIRTNPAFNGDAHIAKIVFHCPDGRRPYRGQAATVKSVLIGRMDAPE